MRLDRLVLSLYLLNKTLAQTCYFPNGNKAPKQYKPCGSSNTTYSTCCSTDQDDRCLLNGLCSWSDHYDYRAACASDDWSGCQKICPMKKNNTWVQVKECASNEYCCNLDQDNDCCKNNSDRFSLRAPRLNSDRKKPGTPAGVIAGAVVGAVIAIIIISGLGFWFIRRKREGRSDNRTIMTDQGNEHPPKYSPASGEAIMEVDAGPENVLVESDAQPIHPRVLHELPA